MTLSVVFWLLNSAIALAQSIPLNSGYNLVAPIIPGAHVTLSLVSGDNYLLGNPTSSSVNLQPLVYVWNPELPDFSQVEIFLGGGDYTTNFSTYYSDSVSPSGWDDENFEPLMTAPTLALGQGFYLSPGDNIQFTLGSGPPFSGAINGKQLMIADSLGVLSVLPDGSSLVFYTGSGFTTDLVNSSYPSGFTDSNGTPLANPPPLPIGQGFFLQLNGGPPSPSLVFPGQVPPFNPFTLVWD